MNRDIAYHVSLRNERTNDTVSRVIRAHDYQDAIGQALAMAADMSDGWRVARVDAL